MCLLAASGLNSLVHALMGNIVFTFSNVTSSKAAGKASRFCDLAADGAHFLAETKHDTDVMRILEGESAAYSRAANLAPGQFEFLFGDVPSPAGHNGIAACLGPHLAKRGRIVPPREGSSALPWVRAGRLALFHLVLNCGRRHQSDRGEASVFVFVVYGTVSAIGPNNELLLAIESWAAELTYAPLFIFGDFNIVLEESHVLQRWMTTGLYHDLFLEAARSRGAEPLHTSHAALGNRRIDFCWVNEAAFSVVENCQVLENKFATHDSLRVELRMRAFVQQAFKRQRPDPLDLAERRVVTEAELADIRRMHQADWDDLVRVARSGAAPVDVRRRALSDLFELWSLRAEHYLVARSGRRWHPRFHQRGRTQPVRQVFVAPPVSRSTRTAVYPGERSIRAVRVLHLQRRLDALRRMPRPGPQ